MKVFGYVVAAGVALAALPALAQENPVKAGVEAWERGDYKGAVDRWRSPAMKGDSDAQFNLGQAYKLGRGVPADLTQAELWYGKAAAQGHEQAEASYALALFANGKREAAQPWLQRAAGRGDPRAQYVLGTMYFNGDVVQKDWIRAYALVTRSSQSGLAEASGALSQMDKYMSVQDRQAGLTLARKYEEEANRPPLPGAMPPVAVASSQAPVRTPPVRTPPRATSPAPEPVRVAASAPAAAIRDGGWRLQLGAFGDPANARKLWSQVGGRFPGRSVSYVKAGSLTKVLVGPFASKGEAAGACRGVSPCVPVSN
ncbi:SPOR domain-containing protein [Sphingomonas sp. HITSZ_GF]|uniref:SPOR domain-containing protein n=1 Tax=Sphingomonas sp. HITSZ_GF TaxID=3037247 RepID=UPI00240E159A|nr:SPOR domain-containing protein [Sphingomonas sp. HITSZ_GF]MDG2532260.1 SPOR domain-containing protein [Sphingomonas sp. HITSZ_GF]